ncbi:MAG: hypothetical protein JXQ90_01630 [Cyclobacteriaceae bacterium]
MKTVLTLCLVIITFLSNAQNIWVADNRPTAPGGAHVFGSVQEAIDASSAGDIIHIIPSQALYADFTVTQDSITIFGIGYNPQKELPNKVTVNNVTIATGVFGVRVSGLIINGIFTISNSAGGSNGNIFLENSDVNRILGNTQCCTMTNASNIVIRNCIIGMRETSSVRVLDFIESYFSATSVVVTNNIISGSSSTSSGGYGSMDISDAIIKNNLFLGNGTNDFAFSTVTTSTISNNVFLGRDPSSDALTGDVSNSTYNNNTSFAASNNSFPIGQNGNSGDSTFVNTDPLLLNVPIVDDWDFIYNPYPDSLGGSPLVDAGSDGTDIGVSGSTIPFSTTGTPLPIISVLNIPEIIKEGTDMNATIEAKGN